MSIENGDVVDIALAQGATASIPRRWVRCREIGSVGWRTERPRALVERQRTCYTVVVVEVPLILDRVGVRCVEGRIIGTCLAKAIV